MERSWHPIRAAGILPLSCDWQLCLSERIHAADGLHSGTVLRRPFELVVFVFFLEEKNEGFVL